MAENTPGIAPTPAGYASVNPFIITRDAEGLIAFLVDVLDGIERPAARTVDDDGLLLHAELQVGGSSIMLAERKPGWPRLPSLLQVYVHDVPAVLERAKARGGEVITEPTPFFGEVFSRMLDPWGNLWWVYSTTEEAAAAWDEGAGWGDEGGEWAAETAGAEGEGGDGGEGSGADWAPTPELVYIHDTLLTAIPRLREPD